MSDRDLMSPRGFDISRSHLDCDVVTGGADGTARVSFPIEVTEGRNGFGPSLGMSYSGSRSNAPYGLGWSLAGAESVTLDMQWRLPTYRDGEDRVALGGVEIVPLRDAAGIMQIEERDGHKIERWRARTERLFERVERWIEIATGRVHWRKLGRDGSVRIYGEAPDNLGRIFDPHDPNRVTEWLLERHHSAKGDVILYSYKAENTVGVDRTRPEEQHRLDPNAQPMRYLKRVQYNPDRPWRVDAPKPTGIEWLFEVVIDYGEHEDINGIPIASETLEWDDRPDSFSSYRRGYELRVRRLARRILMVHNLDELPAPTCVAAVEFVFEQSTDGMVLKRARRVGYRHVDTSQPAASLATPYLEFDYANAQPETGFLAGPSAQEGGLLGSIDRTGHAFVDLFGTGLPGLLMRNMDAWLYRENLGGGRFAPAQPLAEAPKIAKLAFDVGDRDGDGRTEAQNIMGRDAGGWRMESNPEIATWEAHQTMQTQARVDFGSGAVQFADLNGDGYSDVLLDLGDRFEWYPAEGPNAYAPARQITKPADHRNAYVGTTTREGGFYWADMTGDGLSDLVRVTSGAVEVWPHLGEGRFGPSFSMDSPPSLPLDIRRDRVFLIDLNRNGCADIMLIGEGKITIWHNMSGNGFADPVVLDGTPRFDTATSLQVMDILADGRSSLVWTSKNPQNAETSLHYLPLTGSVSPGLLTEVRTGMGLTHRLTWGWSGEDFVAARQSDQPWATYLPRHRPVLRQLEGEETVTGTRRVSIYSYADGGYDHDERRFVGFGYIESRDQELGDGVIENAPPRVSRTWIHLGAAQPAKLARSWDRDPDASPPASHVVLDADVMPTRDYDDAIRAIAGLNLRREIFGCDLEGRPEEDPLSVTSNSYHIERLQPNAGAAFRAVFAPLDAELLSWTYDGDINDPRVSHSVRLSRSAAGGDELKAEIAYARRSSPDRHAEQSIARGSIHRKSYTGWDDADHFYPDLLLETERFEINNLGDQASVYSFDELQTLVTTALASVIDFGTIPSTAFISASRREWERVRYWHKNGSGAATQPADIGFPVLPHSTQTATMSRARFDALYSSFGSTAGLLLEGHLSSESDYVWTTSAFTEYLPDSGFYRISATEKPGGGRTEYSWRSDHIATLTITAEDGSSSTAVLDPFTASVAQTVDPNGTADYTQHDPLGQPVRLVSVGSQLDASGVLQPIGGNAPVTLSDPHSGIDLDTAMADAVAAIGTDATVIYYDTDTIPNRVFEVQRESHLHDGDGNVTTPTGVRRQITYLAGDGGIAQVKVYAGDGPAITRDGLGEIVLDTDSRPLQTVVADRWLTNGFSHTTPNGLLLAEYDGFFSPTPDYEADEALLRNGVSVMMHYDAFGRAIRMDYPDGTVSRQTYGPWMNESWDRNDAVSGTSYELTRSGLSSDNPLRIALMQAQEHADTPSRVHLDTAGEAFLTVEFGAAGTSLESRANISAVTGIATVRDPRGLEQITEYDMVGNIVRQISTDSGEAIIARRWDGQNMRNSDARGFVQRSTYDTMGRLRNLYCTPAGGSETLKQRVTFGDDLPLAEALSRNMMGQVVSIEDGSGKHEVSRRSIFAQVLQESRQYLEDHITEPDWDAVPAPVLESETYTTSYKFDAVGRMIKMITADGTVLDHEFGTQGTPSRVAVTTSDGLMSDQTIGSDFDYDAKGSLVSHLLGNGTSVSRSYDQTTGQLARIRSEGPTGRLFQDMTYTFDPMGNLVLVEDAAQNSGVSGAALSGVAVSAQRRFAHDPHYRLVRSEGRVHRALQLNDYANGFGTGSATKNTRHITLNNGAEVERYTRHYRYDAGGNITQIRHIGDTLNWTRDNWVSVTSNRSMNAHNLTGALIANPETWFDASGHTLRMPHLESIEWSWQHTLQRAVIIDRGGPGLDDAEYNQYDAAMQRMRRVVERNVSGVMEINDTRFLPGCTIRKVHKVGSASDLQRSTVEIEAAGQMLARLHQWQVDSFARETDSVAEKRLRYELSDNLGSATMELDETAGIVTYEEYFAYGGSAFIAGDDIRDVRIKENRFAGGLRDDATGLYVFGHRHYAPFVGNWLSPDPSGASDGQNLYRYARNNPIRFVDRTGLRSNGVDVRYIRFDQLPANLQTSENRANGYSFTLDPNQEEFVEAPSFAAMLAHAAANNLPVYIYDPQIQELYETHVADPSAETLGDIHDQIQENIDELNAQIQDYNSGAGQNGQGGENGGEENGEDPTNTEDGQDDENQTGTGTGNQTGTGPGSGSQGNGPGGGGEAEEIATTPGSGIGAGNQTGPGTGTTGNQNGTPGSNGTTPGATGNTSGGDGNVPGADGNGTNPDARGKTPGGNGPPGSDGTGNSQSQSGNGNAEGAAPPPDAPVGENGVPYTPGMSYTPIDQIPEGAQFTNDPSLVSQGAGDQRGQGGAAENPDARPSGQGGSGGAAGGQPGEQGAQGGGPGGQGEGGDPRNTDGRRGIKGGGGDLELPAWLGWIDPALDGLQIGLDVLGLIPGFGEIADGINGVISLIRGDYVGASLSFAAMIPFLGWGATAGKFGRRAMNAADLAGDVTGAVMRNGDSVVARARGFMGARWPWSKGPGVTQQFLPNTPQMAQLAQSLRGVTQFGDDVADLLDQGKVMVTILDDAAMNQRLLSMGDNFFDRAFTGGFATVTQTSSGYVDEIVMMAGRELRPLLVHEGDHVLRRLAGTSTYDGVRNRFLYKAGDVAEELSVRANERQFARALGTRNLPAAIDRLDVATDNFMVRLIYGFFP